MTAFFFNRAGRSSCSGDSYNLSRLDSSELFRDTHPETVMAEHNCHGVLHHDMVKHDEPLPHVETFPNVAAPNVSMTPLPGNTVETARTDGTGRGTDVLLHPHPRPSSGQREGPKHCTEPLPAHLHWEDEDAESDHGMHASIMLSVFE